VHRDLKPGNILLTPDGDVKILDLGLARFLQDQIGDATLTLEGSGVGTPDYMAPEQFTSARHVDPRADIYSLGCTLYHLIAGRVPFPTSSLTEKYKLHEQHEPPPLEDLCPDMPAGLAMAVARMMAKRPADRFQTAAETAEALAPYVAGSSQSFRGLKATASWRGSQLGISVRPLARGRRKWMIVSAVSGAAAALLLLLWLGPSLLGPARTVPADPNVLTVAQDGGGQHRTIGDALQAAQPGQTIRILDNATYDETLTIDNADIHAGLTIEAEKGAILASPAQQRVLLRVRNVPSVTVRGLRFRADGPLQTLVVVQGSAPGVKLQQLQFSDGKAKDYDALVFLAIKNSEDDPPAVVEDCVFQRAQSAVAVMGTQLDLATPDECRRVVVRGCVFQDTLVRAVQLAGSIREIQVVGNRFQGGCQHAGLQLEHLNSAADLLIANNTFFNVPTAIRLWDFDVSGERIELINNLVLRGSETDFLFLESGGIGRPSFKGQGDGRLAIDRWRLDRNWRESPTGDAMKGWIPLGPSDVRQDTIDVQSRAPQHDDFLRPAADSPLATGGAGGDLPKYVGALPPEGAQTWDWDRTWNSRHP
jgi:hypothetical protein